MYRNNERFDKIARHSKSNKKKLKDIPTSKPGVITSRNGCEYLMSELNLTKKKAAKIIGKPQVRTYQCAPAYGRGACNQTWENSRVRKLTNK